MIAPGGKHLRLVHSRALSEEKASLEPPFGQDAAFSDGPGWSDQRTPLVAKFEQTLVAPYEFTTNASIATLSGQNCNHCKRRTNSELML